MIENKKSEFQNLTQVEKRERYKEIAGVFFKLGATAFGGPAAHIAMMDDEIVKKRKWLSREKFLDLLGATNLIPGPNSTELAIHLGYERGGILGLLLAGSCFILPAMLIVLFFAVSYMRFGTLPEVANILYGIKPIIIAIVLQALYNLGKSAVKNKNAGIIGAGVILLAFMGLGEILLLAIAGLAMMIIANWKKLRGVNLSVSLPLYGLAAAFLSDQFEQKKMSLTTVFLTFLKIGSVLYGSGYVLLAFLESELVERFQVLTSQQLLDAVAVGQFTPGPVFTTATFVGYIIKGYPGAILATIGIFLPAFVLVWAINPFIARLRSSSWVSGILDGVNVASWGLMVVVSWKLGVSAITDWVTAALAMIALALVFRTKINSAWLILAGGIIGWMMG